MTKIKRIYFLLLVVFALAPGFALADSLVYPQEVLPSTNATFDFHLDFPQLVDTVTITDPTSTASLALVSAFPTPASISSTSAQWGSLCSALGTTGVSFYEAHVTATTGTVSDGDWRITGFRWSNRNADGTPNCSSGSAISVPITGVHVTVTYNPSNVAIPPAPPADSAIGSALGGTGINSVDTIKGWLPPGPIDSLLALPITLTNEIIAAASDPVDASFDYLDVVWEGHDMRLSSGQDIYTGLGTAVTDAISAMLSFFLLYFWMKSLYHRLARASQLQTHAGDTWGVL